MGWKSVILVNKGFGFILKVVMKEYPMFNPHVV